MGYTHQNNKREDFYPGDHTRFTTWTGDRYFQRGSYSINNGESNHLSLDLTAHYSHQWGKHLFLSNAAYSLQSSDSNTEGMTAWGFLNNHVDYITFAKQYAEDGKPSGSESTTRSLGITGAANYSYDERYLLDLSLRFNGSSVFGTDNRWGNGVRGWGVGWSCMLATNTISPQTVRCERERCRPLRPLRRHRPRILHLLLLISPTLLPTVAASCGHFLR